MPFIGIGLHFASAIFCAIHAVRSGQQTYWLFILFSFPMLGSVVYLLTIYLPHGRLHRQANRTLRAVGRALDPGRELREARAALEETPTAQNQMRLAAALLAADQLDEAAATYEQCLQGPFANDADTWHAELEQQQRKWNAHTRELNAPLLARLREAQPKA
ncbi:hypothetical protein [Inhella crocodyli]|uniref:Tetratricopeptide repeat protein n=1 Tax=Inhella crocodyli TaxID=2499851 RepID=A0A3S2XYU5_9BURK|nr:hypothetical protein [Inhella crocodyli]RVT87941.1 hypothetical protein EOD73_02685 [Inhella crocodyli]